MIFGIDYDNTFTRDPELWHEFVLLARSRGHECVVVTGRSDEGQFGAEVRKSVGNLMQIVFAGFEWKREAALKRGWKVDVWIDDAPEYVAKQMPIIAMHKK